jgi:hypothetical protein
MTSTDLFALLWMLPFALMAWLVIRHHFRAAKHRRATAINQGLIAYHDSINARHHLPNRSGGAILETLAALLFCAAIATVVLICLSDLDVMTLRPALRASPSAAGR